MRRGIRVAVPAVAAVFGLAACGSSNSTLSYSAFSVAAGKICAAANSQARALGGASQTASPAAAEPINKSIGLAKDGIAKLNKLSGPSALESARDTVVADLNTQITTAQAAVDAAKSSNQAAYEAALTKLSAQSSTSNTDGAKLGAPDCTHS